MTVFVKKNTIFKNLNFTIFVVSWSIFKLYKPILTFWNTQSLIYNILLFENYAMNGMTEIKEIVCVLFLLSDSTSWNEKKIVSMWYF